MKLEAGDYVIDSANDTCLIVRADQSGNGHHLIRWYSKHEPAHVEQLVTGTVWRSGIQRIARPEEIALAKLRGVV